MKFNIYFSLEADKYFFETYEEQKAADAVEYGTRTQISVPPCGRNALKLQSNLLPFVGGQTKDSSGVIIESYNVLQYRFVSLFY